jgi:CRISPR-associated exonuclease Cas4
MHKGEAMGEDVISASEIERFGYCHLSWWLGRNSKVTSAKLREGDRRHEMLSDDLISINKNEKRAMQWEKLVLGFSLIAALMAVIAIFLVRGTSLTDLLVIIAILICIWWGVVIFLVYRSGEDGDLKRTIARREIAAMALGVLAFVGIMMVIDYANMPPQVALIFTVVSLVWLIGTSVALHIVLTSSLRAEEKRRSVHVDSKVTYIGTESARLLRSEKYGLSGRPDYIIEVDGEPVPVDLKSGRMPKGPLFSHILQVAAYCLLLSEESGKRVSHGILKYGDVEHDIEFTPELEQLLLEQLAEMRRLAQNGEVHRNHGRPGKCRSCSRRELCPEKLE